MARASTNVVKIRKANEWSVDARRKLEWSFPPNGPQSVDDLTFTSRDEMGRMCWWDVTPPKTDYWHVHELLGRAYAFELLDLMHNPAADCPPRILGYIADEARRSYNQVRGTAAAGIASGFFESISEFFVTGRLDR